MGFIILVRIPYPREGVIVSLTGGVVDLWIREGVLEEVASSLGLWQALLRAGENGV